MPQVHLPETHDDADLVLASQIAHVVGADQLYVAWTHQQGAGVNPRIVAELREPLNPVAELLGILFDSAADVWRALTGQPIAEPASRIRPLPIDAGPAHN